MSGGASIVPIAFPLIAGPGALTGLLSLRADYAMVNILIGLPGKGLGCGVFSIFAAEKLCFKLNQYEKFYP